MKILFLLLLSMTAILSAFQLKNVETGKCVDDTDYMDGTGNKFYKVNAACSLLTTSFTLDNEVGADEVTINSKFLNVLRRKCMEVKSGANPSPDSLSVTGRSCAYKDKTPAFQWVVTDVGDDVYLFQHKDTQLCLVPQVGGMEYLMAAANCSTSNNLMLWTY